MKFWKLQDLKKGDFLKLICFEQCGSTNDYIKQNLDSLSHGTVVSADFQTKGRGRIGRSFEGEKGTQAAFSVLFKDTGIDTSVFMPVIAGVVVCKALSSITKCDFGIKWPNDILINSKKICGILCDRKKDCTVVGIGINLLQAQDFFSHNKLPDASSVFIECGKKISPQDAVKAVCEELFKCYELFLREGKREILEEYRKSCLTLGLSCQSGDFEGVAVDILDDGSLLLKNAESELSVNSGEVVVRLAQSEYLPKIPQIL